MPEVAIESMIDPRAGVVLDHIALRCTHEKLTESTAFENVGFDSPPQSALLSVYGLPQSIAPGRTLVHLEIARTKQDEDEDGREVWTLSFTKLQMGAIDTMPPEVREQSDRYGGNEGLVAMAIAAWPKTESRTIIQFQYGLVGRTSRLFETKVQHSAVRELRAAIYTLTDGPLTMATFSIDPETGGHLLTVVSRPLLGIDDQFTEVEREVWQQVSTLLDPPQ